MSQRKSSKQQTNIEKLLLLVLSAILVGIIAVGVVVRFIIPSDRPVPPDPSQIAAQSTNPTEETTVPTEEISYTEAEAMRVAGIVQSKQTSDSFSFLAFSDLHENAESSVGNKMAGDAAVLIRNSVKIDFAVLLGDITSGTSTTTIEEGIAEMEASNKYLNEAFSGIPNFRTVGNHDVLTYSFIQNDDYLDNEKIYPYIGVYNAGAVNAEHTGGYCYRDFEEYKVRVICLNTSDMDNVTVVDNRDNVHMSAAQLKWFAEALDLSGKTNVQDWGILILSHIPLDFQDLVNSAGKILDAYTTGTSTSFYWDDSQVSYDYTGKSNAEIIANIHGHNHCFLVDNMYVTNQVGAMYLSPIKRICIPNASFGRNNERGSNYATDSNGIEFGEKETYLKTPNSAENTSFNVITVDREKKTIHCTNYGAGYDREIAYAEGVPSDRWNPFSPKTPAPTGTYTNLVPTAQVLVPNSSKVLDGIGYRNHAYLSSGETLFGHDAECVITGGMPYQIPSYGVPPTIYIWGATLDNSNHVRFFIFDHQKRNVVLHAAGEEIANYFTIETLGDMYYKLTPLPQEDDSLLYPATNGRAGNGFIAWSLNGVGQNLVITMNEPIISE